LHAETHDDLAIALTGLCRQDLSSLSLLRFGLWSAVFEQFDAPFGKELVDLNFWILLLHAKAFMGNYRMCRGLVIKYGWM